MGPEADPERLTQSMVKTMLDFNVKFVGADLGFGFGLNDRVLEKLYSINAKKVLNLK
jgi:hypothetical protein